MGRPRVCLVGVGNNSAALVQGVYRYRDPDLADIVDKGEHGLLFPSLCGYGVADVEFACAFDVDERKVGTELGEAIFSEPNNYPRVIAEQIRTGTVVSHGPVLDGVPPFLAERVSLYNANGSQPELAEEVRRVARIIREAEAGVVVNFLPSGSDAATTFYARAAAAAGAAYINCTPSPAVHLPEMIALFEQAGVPLLGDDLESHFGSSLIHRTVLQALEQRGLQVTHSHQINLGGNMDFKNLSHRGAHKKQSKMAALGSIRNVDRVSIMPSGGFIPGLGDRKVGYVVIEGLGWLGMPVTIDIKIQVQDSSNAAGVVIDLVRIAQAAVDRRIKGVVPMPYYFKRPQGMKPTTEDALQLVIAFDQASAQAVADD